MKVKQKDITGKFRKKFNNLRERINVLCVKDQDSRDNLIENYFMRGIPIENHGFPWYILRVNDIVDTGGHVITIFVLWRGRAVFEL